MFVDMIKKYESMTFDVSLEDFNKHLKADDWYNV